MLHTENYTESPNNVGVSFINKKAPVRRLFEPEAFHIENYTKITQQCACVLQNRVLYLVYDKKILIKI